MSVNVGGWRVGVWAKGVRKRLGDRRESCVADSMEARQISDRACFLRKKRCRAERGKSNGRWDCPAAEAIPATGCFWV